MTHPLLTLAAFILSALGMYVLRRQANAGRPGRRPTLWRRRRNR